MGRKIYNPPSYGITGIIRYNAGIELIAVCLVCFVVYSLKVLGSGKIVLESVILCAVVVYCFVFSCAYVEVLRTITDDV